MLRKTVSALCQSASLHVQRAHGLTGVRSVSAWIDSTKTSSTSKGDELDIEKLFTNDDVQKILGELTGVELDRVFAERVFDSQERSHFALMTDKMYQESLERLKVEGRNFLQFVPFKEPRKNIVEVLSKDPLLEGYDQSKFVFVDITFDATNRDRTVVIREADGVLRTATPEEHDRMNRIFFEQPNRPVFEPALFKDPYLKEALDRDDHEYVLDYACYFYEPDSPAFVKLSREIFDRTVAEGKFQLLHSSRHFGAFTFYLVINDNITPLLNYFASSGSLSNAAKLIRLYKIVHRNWRVAIGSEDDDKKIVEDYIKQNRAQKAQLTDLIKLVSGKIEHAPSPSASSNIAPEDTSKLKARIMDKEKLRGREGPLGDMADEYVVTVAKSSSEAEETKPERRKISLQERRRSKPRTGSDPKKRLK